MKKNWLKISTISSIVLTIITAIAVIISIVAVHQTNDAIDKTKQQFQELNRPFVVIEPRVEILGTDANIFIKNIGNTAANDLKIDVYYFDDKQNKQSLLNETDILDTGIVYPKENRTINIKNPSLYLKEMKNKILTISLEYNFFNTCVKYIQSITAISNTSRQHAPTEYMNVCE